MTIDGPEDLEGLQRSGAVVAEARDAMLAAVQPGISTGELDAIGRRVLRSHGARSAPRLAYNFPGTTCISVNDEAAHGIPSTTRILNAGDLVNIDVSAELDGYWTDTGASTAVGEVAPLARQLLDATYEAQRAGMAAARAGQPISRVGRSIEKVARRRGFGVVENLCGHGVGRSIHEEPSVPGVDTGESQKLWEGLVIAIEPFLTTGSTYAIEDDDGWTLRMADRCMVAQFEHSIVVTNGTPIVLTASAA